MTNELRKAAEQALEFCEDIGDLGGPYPYVNGTAVVSDSRKVLQALRQALAQPKREWVGLTDDEVFEFADTNLYEGGKNYGILSFGKAIEQALKEKNA